MEEALDTRAFDTKALLQDGDVIKCGETLIFNPFNPFI